jgi:hypothetical protein
VRYRRVDEARFVVDRMARNARGDDLRAARYILAAAEGETQTKER